MKQKVKPEIAIESSFRQDLLELDVQRRSNSNRLAKADLSAIVTRNDLLPRLQVRDWPIENLQVPSRNVRKVETPHVREIANSISLFGFTNPILVNSSGSIVDGVSRVEAAKILGLPSVPGINVDHLTSVEQKHVRLATNRLAEKGAWDLDELKLELEELILDDCPIPIVGFDGAEIDAILSEAPELEQGPLAPSGAAAVTKHGDTLLLGKHRVVCGDATDPETVRRLMHDDEARFVFTDQPYNVPIRGHVTRGGHREFGMASGEMTAEEFQAFNSAWIDCVSGHLVSGGLLATFIDWRGLMSVSMAALNAGLSQLNLIVWSKSNAGMGSLYRSQHEMLPLFKKGVAPHKNNIKLGRKGRCRSNVWSAPGASTIGSDARRGLLHHPTVKPVAMLAEAILDLTDRGDIVLDPFLGSGSTLIAAERKGRICYGIELDSLYVDVIARRYEEVTGRMAILEETGETFQALAERRLLESLDHPTLPTMPASDPQEVRGEALPNTTPPRQPRQRVRDLVVPPAARLRGVSDDEALAKPISSAQKDSSEPIMPRAPRERFRSRA